MTHTLIKNQRSSYLLLLIAYLLVIILPSYVISDYLAGLLVLAFLYSIIAVNTDIIWGYTGILTFASAAMFGIGAYSLGIIFVHWSTAPWAMLIAIVVAIVISTLLSALIGWLVFYSRIKVSDFYIAVVTLGIGLSFSQIMLYGGSITGGSNGLSGFPSLQLSERSWYQLTGTFLFLVIFLSLVVVRSDFGLLLRSIRDNSLRCRYLGINIPFIKTLTFCGANAVIAVAGVFYALHSTLVTPSLAGMLLTTDILIWVILGGRSTIIGPALAAVVLSAVRPFLSTEFPLAWQALLGILFVIVVVAMPRGLIPVLGDLLGKYIFGRKSRPATGSKAAQQFSQTVSLPGDDQSAITSNNAADSLKQVPESAVQLGDVVLETADVTKRYGSFFAVDSVDFSIRKGELVSIVGPNGAGKTSFARCISDGSERTQGTVLIGGNDLRRSPPEVASVMGLGRKFQAPSIFESLSVADCLRVASWKGKIPSVWRRADAIVLPQSAVTVIRLLDLDQVWDSKSGDISHGQRQALELAMVLSLEPILLLLDEPTAGLTKAERARVGDVLQQIVAEGDTGIILIEHDFEFVKHVSSRVVVLVAGRLVADGTIEEIADSELVRDVYLGRQ